MRIKQSITVLNKLSDNPNKFFYIYYSISNLVPMKKILLLASLALMIAGSSFAGQAELFSYDQEALNMEMASLTDLENFVAENPGVTMSDLVASENNLVADISNSNTFQGFDSMYEEAFGIGGFWWGCCLGPVGVLVVFLVADDSSQTRKSIVGCIISSLLSGGSGLLWGSSGII